MNGCGPAAVHGTYDSHVRVSILDDNPAPMVQHSEPVPRQLERIVSKALSKDRNKRYQTVTDLKLDLEQLREELHLSRSDAGHKMTKARVPAQQRRAMPRNPN